MNEAQRLANPGVVQLASRPRRQRDRLPEHYACAVLTLEGTVQRDASVLIDIEDRRTIMFRVNTIYACARDLKKVGVRTAVYDGEIKEIEPLLREYDQWCPPLKRVHECAPHTGPDVWLPLQQANAVAMLLQRLTAVSNKVSGAVAQWHRINTYSNQ